MPTWNVKLFAYLKDRFGPEIEVEAEPRALAVLEALRQKGLPVEHCRLAIDNEFSIGDEPIAGNSELALIPPVSGG